MRFPYRNGDLTASGVPETIVSDLATGGNHWTRDVAFSPDGKTMYVAVGSASNVAEQMGPRPADFAAFEKTHSPGSAWDREDWRANVLTYDPDGKNKQVFASSVRNCSGLTVQPGTGVVYCATNERDLLGDNLPPDYVAGIKQGAFYGWPWYYIGNHEDTRPGGGRRPDLADKVTVPDVLIQPHSAPLGIAFDPGGQFPPDWKGDAFVALHGSWNRALRTGYKIIRLPFKAASPPGNIRILSLVSSPTIRMSGAAPWTSRLRRTGRSYSATTATTSSTASPTSPSDAPSRPALRGDRPQREIDKRKHCGSNRAPSDENSHRMGMLDSFTQRGMSL